MSEVSRSQQRITMVECWTNFCDGLEQLGHDVVLTDTAPDNFLEAPSLGHPPLS